MPLCDDFRDDEPEIMDFWRFTDCIGCQNRTDPAMCAECPSGENYEEAEPEGLDSLFRE